MTKTKKEGEESMENGNINQMMVIGIVIALILGFAGGYILKPETAATTGEEFTPDQTKVAKIATVLEKLALLNSGSEVGVVVNQVTSEDTVVLEVVVEGQTTEIYVTGDYQYIIGSKQETVDELEQTLDEYLVLMGYTGTEDSGTETEVEQSEVPSIQLYLMSYCPYGNQAENGLKDVILLLSEQVDFEPVYIISSYEGEYMSLHGQAELDQGIREKIIFNEYGESMWAEYVYLTNAQCSLDNIETCWKETAQELGLNIQEIESIFASDYETIAESEYQKSVAKGYSASPTMLINGQDYSGSRTAEAYKSGICAYFLEAPEECTEELSSEGSDASGTC